MIPAIQGLRFLAAEGAFPGRYVVPFYHVGQPGDWLANTYKTPVTIEGYIFPTIEHYFQAAKFCLKGLQAGYLPATVDVYAAYQANLKRLYDNNPGQLQSYMSGKPVGVDFTALGWHGSADNLNGIKHGIIIKAIIARLRGNPSLVADLKSLPVGTMLVEHTNVDKNWADGGNLTGTNHLGIINTAVMSLLNDDHKDINDPNFEYLLYARIALVQNAYKDMQAAYSGTDISSIPLVSSAAAGGHPVSASVAHPAPAHAAVSGKGTTANYNCYAHNDNSGNILIIVDNSPQKGVSADCRMVIDTNSKVIKYQYRDHNHSNWNDVTGGTRRNWMNMMDSALKGQTVCLQDRSDMLPANYQFQISIAGVNATFAAKTAPVAATQPPKTKSSLVSSLLVVAGLLGVVIAVCNPLILPALSVSLGLGAAVSASAYATIYAVAISAILAIGLLTSTIKPGNNAIQSADGFVHMIASSSSSAASAKVHSAPAPVIRMAPRAADVVDHKTQDDDQSHAIVAGARPRR